MAPTKEELLVFLQQLQAEHPQLTREELITLAWQRFAATQANESAAAEELAGLNEATAELVTAVGTEPEAEPSAVPPETPDISDSAEPAEQAEAELAEPVEQPKDPLTLVAPTPVLPGKSSVMAWPILNRRMVLIILFGAVLFSLVFTSLYIKTELPPPSVTEQEDLSGVATAIAQNPPNQTGEVSRFGKQFAADVSYYEKKYKNTVFEIVGLVEAVDRIPAGNLEATLILADAQNKVFRARFRFLSEQEKEAVTLAVGTMAVLKGRYSGYQQGIIFLYPSVVVYNSAQPGQ